MLQSSYLRAIPATGGSYVLVLASPHGGRISVGRLGTLRLEAGFYLYAGSALGPGGLKARLTRHARRDKPPQWHIDYLRRRTKLEAVWWLEDRGVREHLWAKALAGLPAATIPLARFGASDCRCRSHLIHMVRHPSLGSFLRRLRAIDPRHPPVLETSVSQSGR